MSVDFNTLQSLGLAETTSATPKKQELGQDQFLKLMVTQLNNQNPLKPQEHTEFLTQMAQFGTVNGLQELQSAFQDFAASAQQDRTLAAANLVGRSALVSADKGMLTEGGTLRGELLLPAAAASVKLRITDSTGKPVKTEELGTQEAGSFAFEWDGKKDDGVTTAPPGTYRVTAEALIDGKNTALETLIAAPVESVTLGGSKSMEVALAGLGRYGLKDIRAVL